MSVTILDALEPEDLDRFRQASATMDLIDARSPRLSMTDEEIRRFYLDYYDLFAELLDRYGIEGGDAIEAKIAPATGHVYIGKEE